MEVGGGRYNGEERRHDYVSKKLWAGVNFTQFVVPLIGIIAVAAVAHHRLGNAEEAIKEEDKRITVLENSINEIKSEQKVIKNEIKHINKDNKEIKEIVKEINKKIK